MENDIIELKDLRKGDEVLVAAGGCKLLYLRVLRNPTLSVKRPVGWNGNPNYTPVKCSYRIETKTYSYGHGGNTHTYTRDFPVCTPDNHNAEKRFNLNDSTIWLVRREDSI